MSHPRLAALAPWAALVALTAALTLQDIRSSDYWWHLRSGQLIAETGEVPTRDAFTYTTFGARWIDSPWLHQLGLWGLYVAGGHAAVVIAQFVLVCAWLAALAPIGWRPGRSWLSVGALTWMLLVAANRLEPRPELPTFVLLACVLHLLDRFERLGDRAVYAIVPLQLLWANLHGLFAMGIAVCGVHIVAELMRPIGRAHEPLRVPRVRRLATVTVLSALVAFANPNGIDGVLLPLQLLGMVSSAQGRDHYALQILEFRPPIGSLSRLSLGLFLGLAALSFGAIAANWRRVREVDLLLWVAFFYLAMGAKRNVTLFAIVAAPMLVRNVNELLDARILSARAHARAATAATALALLVTADVASGTFYDRIGRPRTAGFGVVEGFNPIGAADWILRTRPPGPIAHWMGDGGYLIWRLWPSYRVMNDGRNLEIFDPDVEPSLLYDDLGIFASLDARFHFGCVLLNHRVMPFPVLANGLRASPAWRLAYLDDVSLAFVRAEGAGARVPELELAAPGLFPPLDDLPGPHAHERLRTRTRTLLTLGRPDLAAQQWEQLLARFPDEPRGEEMLAALRGKQPSLPPKR